MHADCKNSTKDSILHVVVKVCELNNIFPNQGLLQNTMPPPQHHHHHHHRRSHFKIKLREILSSSNIYNSREIVLDQFYWAIFQSELTIKKYAIGKRNYMKMNWITRCILDSAIYQVAFNVFNPFLTVPLVGIYTVLWGLIDVHIQKLSRL